MFGKAYCMINVWQTHFGVPPEFRVRMPFAYPPSNKSIFEEWYLDNYSIEDAVDFTYLPVLWNGYHVSHNYGNDPDAISRLQLFIDGLDRQQRYYTIHQYDDGPLVDFKDLNILCFGMSSGRIDVPIPLIGMPQPWNLGMNKTIFLNFIGRRTHPIREILFQSIRHGGRNYIAEHNHQSRNYSEVIAQSTFTLAPRGYGPTSFRVMESLQYQSVPVYISDCFVEAFNVPFEEYGVKIEAKDAHRVEEILGAIPHYLIEQKRKRGMEVFKEYYTYEGCKRNILKHLRNGE
jgi:hypothetical protein